MIQKWYWLLACARREDITAVRPSHCPVTSYDIMCEL